MNPEQSAQSLPLAASAIRRANPTGSSPNHVLSSFAYVCVATANFGVCRALLCAGRFGTRARLLLVSARKPNDGRARRRKKRHANISSNREAVPRSCFRSGLS